MHCNYFHRYHDLFQARQAFLNLTSQDDPKKSEQRCVVIQMFLNLGFVNATSTSKNLLKMFLGCCPLPENYSLTFLYANLFFFFC